MIARLSGTLALMDGNLLIVDVGGVGYRVMTPVGSLGEIGAVGAPVTLFTHMSVREDDISLYGFTTHEQLKAFEILIGVTGIGPKVAMAILSSLDVGSLAHAVTIGDTRTLSKAPGLGPKTAQRLVLELRDKFGGLAASAPGTAPKAGQRAVPPAEQFTADIVDALVGLGYNRKDAERAADRVIGESEGETLSTATVLKEALNVLTGNR